MSRASWSVIGQRGGDDLPVASELEPRSQVAQVAEPVASKMHPPCRRQCLEYRLTCGMNSVLAKVELIVVLVVAENDRDALRRPVGNAQKAEARPLGTSYETARRRYPSHCTLARTST